MPIIMEFRKEGPHLVIRLEKGENVVEKLNNFLSEKRIMGGFFQGIGAVSEAEIGWYDAPNKKYDWKKLTGDMEVISLMGSITELGIHAHIVLADNSFAIHGGHLKEAVTGSTLEIFLTELKKIRKKDDPKTGLKLMEL